MIKFGLKIPPRGIIEKQGARLQRANERAAHTATDRASKVGQKYVQNKMRAVGLNRLAGAVGHTSSKRKGRTQGGNAWGVIYARGSDESRAGGALEAYSRGVEIKARKVTWMAFQTNRIPRRIGGWRMTPDRYRASGLEQSIGKLVFKRISVNRALLVIRKVTVSPKTGRAKADAGRRTRTRIRMKEVIAFILIKRTARAKRFDHIQIMRLASDLVGKYIVQERSEILSRSS